MLIASYLGCRVEFRPVPLNVSVDCTLTVSTLFLSIPSQAFSSLNSWTELRMGESRGILVSGH